MNTRNIAKTGVLLALLIVIQVALKPAGQLFVGSGVNLVLIASVYLVNTSSAVLLAILSPITATILGQNAFPAFIPFIIVGNLILVLIWHFLVKQFGNTAEKIGQKVIALILGAGVKAVFMYLAIAVLMAKVILKAPAPKQQLIGTMMGTMQFIAAIIGGILAILIIPALLKIPALAPDKK